MRWIDGDTFRLLDARGRYVARLSGFNALESWGPVHRWGNWSPGELRALAEAATRVAASRSWTCTTLDGKDRYQRTLVTCPGLAAALVRRGLAMAFSMRGPADPGLLRRQRAAQRRRAGMWANGIPATILTSVHSADEPAPGGAYDRAVDTRSGEALSRPHARVYEACQEVCNGSGPDRSCMVYVPFQRRHHDRPPCLDP